MTHFLCFLLLFLLLGLLIPGYAASQPDPQDFIFADEVCAYARQKETYLRSIGPTANTLDITDGEYLSFCAYIQYKGSEPLQVESMYLTINGVKYTTWLPFTMECGYKSRFHVYAIHMDKLTEFGTYQLDWYINGVNVHTGYLTIDDQFKWESVFPMPPRHQITAHNQASTRRSPYLAAWLQTPSNVNYTQYSIDFKADYLPNGTYCCPANWTMDLSTLAKHYTNLRNNYSDTYSVHAYAGFQRLRGANDYCSIMSVWDIFGTDENGNTHRTHPRLVYPAERTNDFSGEGTGVQVLVPYAWEAEHWYRMLLRCFTGDNGNTWIQQWVCDLETGQWTLLCCYDMMIQQTAMRGHIAVFLENYRTEFSGEIRTLEFRNVKILLADTQSWHPVTTASIHSEGGLPKYEGSYAFGAHNDTFWMITSGVGGDWLGSRHGQQRSIFSVSGGNSSAPYTNPPWQ